MPLDLNLCDAEGTIRVTAGKQALRHRDLGVHDKVYLFGMVPHKIPERRLGSMQGVCNGASATHDVGYHTPQQQLLKRVPPLSLFSSTPSSASSTSALSLPASQRGDWLVTSRRPLLGGMNSQSALQAHPASSITSSQSL